MQTKSVMVIYYLHFHSIGNYGIMACVSCAIMFYIILTELVDKIVLKINCGSLPLEIKESVVIESELYHINDLTKKTFRI